MILKQLPFLAGVACFRAGQAHPMQNQTWSNNTNNRESQDITYRPIIIIIIKTSVTQKEKSKGIFMEGYPGKYDFLLFLRIRNYCRTTTCTLPQRLVYIAAGLLKKRKWKHLYIDLVSQAKTKIMRYKSKHDAILNRNIAIQNKKSKIRK